MFTALREHPNDLADGLAWDPKSLPLFVGDRRLAVQPCSRRAVSMAPGAVVGDQGGCEVPALAESGAKH